MRRAGAACTLVLASLLALACGRGDLYHGTGVVRGVDREARQLVVAHDDIPHLMPAMTMNFDVADPALLEGLAPGQRIAFDLRVGERSYRIVAVKRLDAGEPGAAGSAGISGVEPAPSGGAAAPSEVAPAFRLTDQSGKPLALADLRGKVVLLDFVYTHCPGPCPVLTGLHADLQRSLGPALGQRVHFVSITLDPARDTPEALAAYARARGADLSTWSFLTGPPDQVADVVKRYGVGTVMNPNGTIYHLVVTFVIDGDGRIVDRWMGLDHTVLDMRAELVRLTGVAPG
jgi:protein SCO1/2